MILMEKLRKDAGLSQRKLGRACQPEVDPSYICNAERHGFRLYPGQAQRIAAALGYEGDPEDLFLEARQSGIQKQKKEDAMDRNEKLAVLTAMDKAIKAELEDLKFSVKEELLELEDAYGVDRMSLKLGGMKVGEVSIVRAKPQVVIRSESYQEAMDALERKGLITITPSKGWQNNFDILPSGDVIDKDTGEIVPWAYASEPFVKGTMVKVKQEDVAKTLATMQPITVAGLLGGAE